MACLRCDDGDDNIQGLAGRRRRRRLATLNFFFLFLFFSFRPQLGGDMISFRGEDNFFFVVATGGALD